MPTPVQQRAIAHRPAGEQDANMRLRTSLLLDGACSGHVPRLCQKTRESRSVTILDQTESLKAIFEWRYGVSPPKAEWKHEGASLQPKQS